MWLSLRLSRPMFLLLLPPRPLCCISLLPRTVFPVFWSPSMTRFIFSIDEALLTVTAPPGVAGTVPMGVIEGCRGLRRLAGQWAALSKLHEEYLVKKLSPHVHYIGVLSVAGFQMTRCRSAYHSQYPVTHC